MIGTGFENCRNGEGFGVGDMVLVEQHVGQAGNVFCDATRQPQSCLGVFVGRIVATFDRALCKVEYVRGDQADQFAAQHGVVNGLQLMEPGEYYSAAQDVTMDATEFEDYRNRFYQLQDALV